MRIITETDTTELARLADRLCGRVQGDEIIINHRPYGPVERIPIISQPGPGDVIGKDVIGPLPLHLASLAEIVWDLELNPYHVERIR